MTKSKYKQSMRMFWTTKWRYERTPEEWVEWITVVPTYERTRNKTLIIDAISKLVLEKKITKQESENLNKMIDSPDKENVLLAITIMAQLKPKKFKKITLNNTETNE